MTQHQDNRVPDAAREALLNLDGHEIVQKVLQRYRETETREHLQATPDQRTEAHTGYRNGYKSRRLRRASVR